MPQNDIDTLCITELLGKNFYIPEYQRGYRWSKTNVLQLLNDIWEYRQESANRYTFYCLQPVVVRKTKWQDINNKTIEGYELIDGQQRLTTIHRILTFILLEHYKKNDLISRGYKENLFSIYYKTRLESKTFLESDGYDKTKPDLYYMSEAYKCIKEWFYDTKRGIPDDVMDDVRRILLPFLTDEDKKLDKIPEWSVQVIWYEINDATQKSEELFKRLNSGKIPLTSAELIKAKFVNSDSFKEIDDVDKIKRRTQLIQIWDEIENQLNNPKFWAFISNENIKKYSNKIEYLFDISARKKANEKDPLFSFIHFFDTKETAKSLWAKWLSIEEIYRSLVYWYSNKKMYHKIGYLIATGTHIGKLVALRKNYTKTEFETGLNTLIAATIPPNWEELRYDKRSEREEIINVLLLTNIELTSNNQNNNEFFPFEMYKSITKSLEHIHAQNIEGIDKNKKEQWLQWLNAHTGILMHITTDKEKAAEVIKEAEKIKHKMIYKDFEQLSEKILNLIPKETTNDLDYLHKIQNMALLGLTENISLSNSIFEVKRRKIVEMDKTGAFIPLATKRVFLKYYANESAHHYSVWTTNEQNQYLEEMRTCLGLYKTESEVANAE